MGVTHERYPKFQGQEIKGLSQIFQRAEWDFLKAQTAEVTKPTEGRAMRNTEKNQGGAQSLTYPLLFLGTLANPGSQRLRVHSEGVDETKYLPRVTEAGAGRGLGPLGHPAKLRPCHVYSPAFHAQRLLWSSSKEASLSFSVSSVICTFFVCNTCHTIASSALCLSLLTDCERLESGCSISFMSAQPRLSMNATKCLPSEYKKWRKMKI